MIPLSDRFQVVIAVSVIFRDGNKILLSRRANTGYFDGSYSLPAGHVDGGEPALMAAIREAREEVGAVLEPSELKLVHVMHRYSTMPTLHERLDLIFETSQPHPEIINAEPEKCDELLWCSLDALPKNLVPEVKAILEKVVAGELYSDFNFPRAE